MSSSNDPSSYSSSSHSPASTSPSTSDNHQTHRQSNPSRNRPIPCKGHTKSRRGCFNCKRRRVRCPETRPECDACIRLGLSCEYPKPKTLAPPQPSQRKDPGGAAMSMTRLSATPTQFSIDDLQFFQHFLLTAYPPLPLKGGDIWKGVARLSHSYDYLIHAMLALAASHLNLYAANDPSLTTDYSSQALTHRVRSMTLLNQTLAQPCTSRPEADARFATLMALTFQSSYMPDGMLDFLSLVRGCFVIPTTKAMMSLKESSFGGFTAESHIHDVFRMSADQDVARTDWHGQVPWYRSFVEQGLASVKALLPLCQDGFEAEYCTTLQNILEAAKISPVHGFAQLCNAYSILNTVPHDAFAQFADPSNPVAQILLIHFFLIEHELGMLSMAPGSSDSFPFRGHITAAWIHEVAKRLPEEYACYHAWPMAYAVSGNIKADMEDRIPLGGFER